MTDAVRLLAIDPDDIRVVETLLALNNAHAEALSLLDMSGFRHLVREAFLACRIGPGDAFMLTFDQTARYNSPNFLWFRARSPKFVYVDRICVSPSARGRGLARRLYQELFEQARRTGHGIVVCEVNIDPPNPDSDAFHASLGFSAIGQAAIHGGAKTVRYMARAL
jgi:uncharacterized protein